MIKCVYLAALETVHSVPLNPLSIIPGGDMATSAIKSMTGALNGLIGDSMTRAEKLHENGKKNGEDVVVHVGHTVTKRKLERMENCSICFSTKQCDGTDVIDCEEPEGFLGWTVAYDCWCRDLDIFQSTVG